MKKTWEGIEIISIQNCLALNVSKTNFVLFFAKNKPLNPVTIIINGPGIEEKDYVKYLGVLIDSKLSFKQHIIGITKQISGAIGFSLVMRLPLSRREIYIC